ncbi:cell envelope protein SmpA [Yersinia intermedia]|uniref:cell envelope protein SmpA n=1 Tax=Yersinia intermedia TaxID=631 RepID=UPI0022FEE454|nr:cell envelope protein SmpA [Yersinia intermedia]MDA5495391.1 cell envelope protein SmpA [Yersinia intermedia]
MELKHLAIIGLVAGSLALSACAPSVKPVDYSQRSMLLSLGMGKGDVMQIMGAPRRTDVNPDRERWIYWNKVFYGYTLVDNEQLATDRLTVTFMDGKVAKWGQQTMTDDMLESTQKVMQASIKASSKY